MTQSPDPEPRPPDGPRYATLMDQMQAWLGEQLAKHPTTPTPTDRRPAPPTP